MKNSTIVLLSLLGVLFASFLDPRITLVSAFILIVYGFYYMLKNKKVIYLNGNKFIYFRLSQLQREAKKHKIEIDNNVVFGKNAKIGHNSKIGFGCVFGDDAEIGYNVIINYNFTAGNNLMIRMNTVIYMNVTVGNDVTIYSMVAIHSNVSIGNNSKVKHGADIGKGVRIDSGQEILSEEVIPKDAHISEDLSKVKV